MWEEYSMAWITFIIHRSKSTKTIHERKRWKIKVRVKIENEVEWQENNIHWHLALKCYSFSQDTTEKSQSEYKVYYLYKKKRVI